MEYMGEDYKLLSCPVLQGSLLPFLLASAAQPGFLEAWQQPQAWQNPPCWGGQPRGAEGGLST